MPLRSSGGILALNSSSIGSFPISSPTDFGHVISKQLLNMLVCPVSQQTLELAPADLLARLNEQIHEGGIVNQAGIAVEDSVSEALLRSDGELLYVGRDAIPIMLSDEAIDLAQLNRDRTNENSN